MITQILIAISAVAALKNTQKLGKCVVSQLPDATLMIEKQSALQKIFGENLFNRQANVGIKDNNKYDRSKVIYDGKLAKVYQDGQNAVNCFLSYRMSPPTLPRSKCGAQLMHAYLQSRSVETSQKYARPWTISESIFLTSIATAGGSLYHGIIGAGYGLAAGAKTGDMLAVPLGAGLGGAVGAVSGSIISFLHALKNNPTTRLNQDQSLMTNMKQSARCALYQMYPNSRIIEQLHDFKFRPGVMSLFNKNKGLELQQISESDTQKFAAFLDKHYPVEAQEFRRLLRLPSSRPISSNQQYAPSMKAHQYGSSNLKSHF